MANFSIVAQFHEDPDIAALQLKALRRHAPPGARFWFIPSHLERLDRSIQVWPEADWLSDDFIQMAPEKLIWIGPKVLVTSEWWKDIIDLLDAPKPVWLKWKDYLVSFNGHILNRFLFPRKNSFVESLNLYKDQLGINEISPVTFYDSGRLLLVDQNFQLSCKNVKVEIKTFPKLRDDFYYNFEFVRFLNMKNKGYYCELNGWLFFRRSQIIVKANPPCEWYGHLRRDDVSNIFPWRQALNSGFKILFPFAQGKKEENISLGIYDLRGEKIANIKIKVKVPRAHIKQYYHWLKSIGKDHWQEAWRLLCRGDIKKIWHAAKLAVTATSSESDNQLPILRISDLKEALSKRKLPLPHHPPVDIIIPIYNQAELVSKLLSSIKKNTTPPYRLILIDDASPETDINSILEEVQKDPILGPKTVVIRNERNRGFVATVNIGLQRSEHDVVILNSDTEVPPGWLDRLLLPLINNPKIASITPMTNCGTIASFPKFCEDNPLLGKIEDIDHIFSYLSYAQPVEAPTGVGFCMVMSRRALNEIGYFDEKTFGRGYGEENDWCQRALKKGFINIIYSGLFVWHKHGGSFQSEEKKKLIAKNLEKLKQRHPNYEIDVKNFIKNDPLRIYRIWVSTQLARKENSLLPLIVLDHAEGGGANTYSKRLVERESQRRVVFHVTFSRGDHALVLRAHLPHGEEIGAISSAKELLYLLDTLGNTEVFYNSFYTYPTKWVEEILEGLANRLKKGSIRFVLAIHDFMPVCPSYNLMGLQDRFCGLPNDMNVCRRCLPANRFNAFPGVTIERWRDLWRPLVEGADEIICFSRNSSELLGKVFKIQEDRLKIRPHEVIVPFKGPIKVDLKAPLNIGVIGNINTAKGAKVVERLVRELERRQYGRLTVVGKLGEVDVQSERLKVTGGYLLEQLPDIILKEKINVVFIPSVCPETFNFVASEIMSLGIPLICFSLGAIPERIKNCHTGLVLPLEIIDDIPSLLNKIINFKHRLSAY